MDADARIFFEATHFIYPSEPAKRYQSFTCQISFVTTCEICLSRTWTIPNARNDSYDSPNESHVEAARIACMSKLLPPNFLKWMPQHETDHQPQQGAESTPQTTTGAPAAKNFRTSDEDPNRPRIEWLWVANNIDWGRLMFNGLFMMTNLIMIRVANEWLSGKDCSYWLQLIMVDNDWLALWPSISDNC